MERKLAEFARLLRQQGLPLSPAELADAGQVLAAVGWRSRSRLRAGLCMSLAKTQPDALIFARCFDQFFAFSDFADSAGSAPNISPQQLPPAAAGEGPLAGSGGGGSGQQADSPLGQMLLQNDQLALQLSLAQAVEAAQLRNIRVMTQRGLFMRRIMLQMGLDALEQEITGLEAQGRAAARDKAQALRVARQRLQDEVRTAVERYLLLAQQNSAQALAREVNLNALAEFHDVKTVVRRMARRLITLHSRRQKLQNRGVLDLRRTLRSNLAYDGLIVEPQWRRRKKDRPKVVAVCDVSRSVSQYSRFLLMFLYSLQEIIPRVRAFAFSSELGEVTELFERLSLDEALDTVLEQYGLGSTDYGQSLLDLERLALDDIDRNTTVIILGDARNNNGEARVERLRLIHARAKQVLWINPERLSRWGSGDSEMLRYKPYCTRAVAVANLAQLERAVDWMLRHA